MIDEKRRLVLKGLVALAGGVLTTSCNESPRASAAAASQNTADPSARPKEIDREYKVAWSVWTGWMPFQIMEEKGFLVTRARQHGVRIKLVKYDGYTDSVKAYTETKVDGVALTSMESLQPASSGASSVGILVNDVSNGGDGVLMRANGELKGLKGKTVLLEEFSVSHYLLARALEKAGLKESDVKIKNTAGDLAGKSFIEDKAVEAAVTWNPYLFKATEAGKGKVVFSSKDIPGEVVDFLVVNAAALKRSPGLGWALADAWYDAMAFIADSKTHAQAIEIMARAAKVSVEEFEKMLAETDLFADRRRCAEFLTSEALKQTMERVQKFSFEHGLIKDDRFKIGFGSSGWEKLRFDPSFARGRG